MPGRSIFPFETGVRCVSGTGLTGRWPTTVVLLLYCFSASYCITSVFGGNQVKLLTDEPPTVGRVRGGGVVSHASLGLGGGYPKCPLAAGLVRTSFYLMYCLLAECILADTVAAGDTLILEPPTPSGSISVIPPPLPSRLMPPRGSLIAVIVEGSQSLLGQANTAMQSELLIYIYRNTVLCHEG